MKKLLDMHTHSIYSDGTDTVKELVMKAKNKKIGTLALTDHDNIEGSKEIIKYNIKDLNIYSGIELTAKPSKICNITLPDSARIHILGYNIDLENEKLNKKLQEIQKYSIENLLTYYEIMTHLHEETIIPPQELEKLMQSKSNIGRPQLADLMIKYGICKTRNEAFDKYLNEAYEIAKKNKKTTGVTEEECLSLILNAGGTPSLAHPNSLKLDFKDLEKRIIYLKSVGLKSLETTHINLNAEERRFLNYLSEKYDLLQSGGTDYHGRGKANVELGTGINENVKIYSLSLTDNIKNRYQRNN